MIGGVTDLWPLLPGGVYDMFRLPFVLPQSGEAPPGAEEEAKFDAEGIKGGMQREGVRDFDSNHFVRMVVGRYHQISILHCDFLLLAQLYNIITHRYIYIYVHIIIHTYLYIYIHIHIYIKCPTL